MPGCLSRLRDRIAPRHGPRSSPDPSFAYRIGWMKEARAWDASRRAAVAAGLSIVLQAPDFVPNVYDRRFRVPALDANLHAGASLLALQQVLAAIESED